jgi:hypothetical protein
MSSAMNSTKGIAAAIAILLAVGGPLGAASPAFILNVGYDRPAVMTLRAGQANDRNRSTRGS